MIVGFDKDLEKIVDDYAQHATRCVVCIEPLDEFRVIDCHGDSMVFVVCSTCFDAAPPDGSTLFDAHCSKGEGESLSQLRQQIPKSFVIVIARGETRKFTVALGPAEKSDAFQTALHVGWMRNRNKVSEPL